MRTLFLIAGIAFIFGCSNHRQATSTPPAPAIDQTTEHIETESNAIYEVFSEYSTAKTNAVRVYFDDLSQMKRKEFDRSKFLNALEHIDTSKCPKDFQLAWMDYVQTFERSKHLGLGSLSLIFSGQFGTALTRLSDEDTALLTSYQAMQKDALLHGVQLPYAD